MRSFYTQIVSQIIIVVGAIVSVSMVFIVVFVQYVYVVVVFLCVCVCNVHWLRLLMIW